MPAGFDAAMIGIDCLMAPKGQPGGGIGEKARATSA